ncbi:ribonuclease YeeF family protein [Psychrobacillus sp. FSL K6-1267]|uniref:ribonuclease YeeF family protein n=1 Tax=Psychrobacillus sp. FSL K6-1267 TaxID=2921543 RepID=UPI0030F74C8C
MKILDVDLLQDGLKRNMAMLERLKTETENIERTVSGLVEMDELLKGEGGYAIRDFYAECHLPFLQFFQLFSETYRQKLQQIESALQSLEPDSAGYIMQEFLEGELEQGLTLIGNLTEALTNEANSIMDSVSDIVSLPHLDDSAVQEGVITSKKKRDDTVQQLNEFDYSQTVSLNPVEQDIQTMDTWLTDIEGMFQSGLTDVHFQSSHWGVLASRNTLKLELEARNIQVTGNTIVQTKNHDLTTMFYTFLTGALPLQFGYGGLIQKTNALYGPSILGFASLPIHTNSVDINKNVQNETNELDEIYAAMLQSNPELAIDHPSSGQTYTANEPITYEGMRKVLGGNGSGTPDGLFGMGLGLKIVGEIVVEEFVLDDLFTVFDPDASRREKGVALLSLTPVGKLKKVAEGAKEGKDILEHIIEAQKKADKAKDTSKDANKSVGDVEVKGTDSSIQYAESGGRNISPEQFFKEEAIAEEMYEKFRNLGTEDVNAIAKNTGFSVARVQRIKNHIFNNSHIKDHGFGRFDPDFELAQAWQRLIDGKQVDSDIQLLHHEIFESKFESIFQTNYRTAHDKTIESGRLWNWEKNNEE